MKILTNRFKTNYKIVTSIKIAINRRRLEYPFLQQHGPLEFESKNEGVHNISTSNIKLRDHFTPSTYMSTHASSTMHYLYKLTILHRG